jgi:SPP1 family predicted phage head-tail adaptor
MKRNVSSRLRHRLTLQQEVLTPDGAGGYARTWSNIADLWAEIIPFSGNMNRSQETTVAAQLQSEISHRILLRYQSGVTAGMRLLFGSRAFNIISIANREEAGEVLELLATEGGA